MSDIKTGDDVVYQDDSGQSRLAKVVAVEGEDVLLSTAFGTQFVPLGVLSSDADVVARVRVNEAANALRWAANSNSPSRVKLGAPGRCRGRWQRCSRTRPGLPPEHPWRGRRSGCG